MKIGIKLSEQQYKLLLEIIDTHLNTKPNMTELEDSLLWAIANITIEHE